MKKYLFLLFLFFSTFLYSSAWVTSPQLTVTPSSPIDISNTTFSLGNCRYGECANPYIYNADTGAYYSSVGGYYGSSPMNVPTPTVAGNYVLINATYDYNPAYHSTLTNYATYEVTNHQIVYFTVASSGVNGSCSSSHYSCATGSSTSNVASTTSWTWTCNGSGGGSNAPCSENYPAVNGSCSSSHYSCATGSSTSNVSSSTQWTWSCSGLYGGTTSSCSENKLGCISANAVNYNSSATIDDGSCIFPNNNNGTSTTANYNGSLSIGIDGNGYNFWYRNSSTRFQQLLPTNWTSKSYVYLFIEGTTTYLYNQTYVYGSSTITNIDTSYTNPDVVRSFVVDGRTISIYRYYTASGLSFPTFEMSIFGSTGSSGTRIYGVIPSNSYTAPSPTSSSTMYAYLSAYSDTSTSIHYSPILSYSSPVSTTTRSVSVGGSLYSQGRNIVNPIITGTTYTYTSPITLPNSKQSGVIIIQHSSSTYPTITWSGVSVPLIQRSTATVQGYVTSLYLIRNPTSQQSILISNTRADTIRHINTTVWSNADSYSSSGQYTMVLSSNRAWIDLLGSQSPITVVGALSVSDLNGYQKLPSTILNSFATSTTGDIAVFSGGCSGNGFIDGCPLGYKQLFSFGTLDGGVVAVSLYATTTATTTISSSVASTTLPTSTFFTDLGQEVSFGACFDSTFNASVLSTAFYSNLGNSFVCLGKNLIFWGINLFIPSSDQINELGTSFYSSVQNGNITTSIFTFFFYLKDLSSTTTPVSSVSLYGFTVPASISNGTFTTSTQMIKLNVGQVSSTTDRRIKDFLNPFFAVFCIFFMGYFVIKLIH